ncbi:MAG: hypothetical protein R3E79_55725 [Caldilineaceae bacterium]
MTQTIPYKLAKKLFPSVSYHYATSLESYFRQNQIASLYVNDMQNEYEIIRPYLPSKCTSTLDIGCGIAGIDIFLHRHYQPQIVHHYLLDKTWTDSRIHYDYKQEGAFYNSLDIAKELLISNKVPINKITLLEANDKGDILIDHKIDLVISLISWGFHYPVSIYIDAVDKILEKGGVIILDVRKGTEGQKLLQSRFSSVKVINESAKAHRVMVIKE